MDPTERAFKKAQQRIRECREARERGQVSPNELVKGKIYTIPSHGYSSGARDEYLIYSVGLKWITYRKRFRAEDGALSDWGAQRKWMKSAWDGPYFLEVTDG